MKSERRSRILLGLETYFKIQIEVISNFVRSLRENTHKHTPNDFHFSFCCVYGFFFPIVYMDLLHLAKKGPTFYNI